VDQFGSIDILVNNAAEVYVCNTIRKINLIQLQRIFQSNVFGIFYMIKSGLPFLAPGAKIINTVSNTGWQKSDDFLDYDTIKGAVAALTKSVAQKEEVVNKKICVNCILTGKKPDMNGRSNKNKDRNKLNNMSLDDDQEIHILPAILYLACEDSNESSGQILHVTDA
jgi:NAD(P)-dependent dehydrogenase (short-subunit alcohol dehydrogenase family)